MSVAENNKVVAILRKFNALLGGGVKGRLYSLDPLSTRTQERWLNGKIHPPASGARLVAEWVWNEVDSKDDLRQSVFRSIREVVPDGPAEWEQSREDFAGWFFGL